MQEHELSRKQVEIICEEMRQSKMPSALERAAAIELHDAWQRDLVDMTITDRDEWRRMYHAMENRR